MTISKLRAVYNLGVLEGLLLYSTSLTLKEEDHIRQLASELFDYIAG